jgi:hypothetical protein
VKGTGVSGIGMGGRAFHRRVFAKDSRAVRGRLTTDARDEPQGAGSVRDRRQNDRKATVMRRAKAPPKLSQSFEIVDDLVDFGGPRSTNKQSQEQGPTGDRYGEATDNLSEF